jgi:hypothetical protein
LGPSTRVVVAQGGQAEGAVLAGVLLVADADQGRFEQAHDGGQHLAARQAGPRQVPLDAGANCRQGQAEGDHAVVLDLVARLPPARVVAVLLAAAGILAGGL